MNPVAIDSDPQVVEQDWRDADAHGIEREVVAFQNALAHNENIEQIADMHGDTQLAGEIRKLCGLLRERRDRRAERARELRTAAT